MMCNPRRKPRRRGLNERGMFGSPNHADIFATRRLLAALETMHTCKPHSLTLLNHWRTSSNTSVPCHGTSVLSRSMRMPRIPLRRNACGSIAATDGT